MFYLEGKISKVIFQPSLFKSDEAFRSYGLYSMCFLLMNYQVCVQSELKVAG